MNSPASRTRARKNKRQQRYDGRATSGASPKKKSKGKSPPKTTVLTDSANNPTPQRRSQRNKAGERNKAGDSEKATDNRSNKDREEQIIDKELPSDASGDLPHDNDAPSGDQDVEDTVLQSMEEVSEEKVDKGPPKKYAAAKAAGEKLPLRKKRDPLFDSSSSSSTSSNSGKNDQEESGTESSHHHSVQHDQEESASDSESNHILEETELHLTAPYLPSFTIFQRFEATKNVDWIEDTIEHSIEVPSSNWRILAPKEPLEAWLQPDAAKKSDPAANHNVYTGAVGQRKDALFSQTELQIPQPLRDRFKKYSMGIRMSNNTLSHKLCLMKLRVNFLLAPVTQFAHKMSEVRPSTRASKLEKLTGNDLWIGATSTKASRFIVKECDDLELVDYVQTVDECLLWHCPDLHESSILFRAVTDILANDESNSVTPISIIQNAPKIQFLGFVSVHTKKNSKKVSAFTIQSFVLYKYDSADRRTYLNSLMTMRELSRSTMQERLIQILQIIQGIKYGSTYLTFSILNPDRAQKQCMYVLKDMGWNVSITQSGVAVATRKHVMNMNRTCMRVVWSKVCDYIDVILPPEIINDGKMNNMWEMFQDILRSAHSFPRLTDRSRKKDLQVVVENAHSQAFSDSGGTVPDCSDVVHLLLPPFLKVVTEAVQVPLYFFTHVICGRLKRGKNSSEMRLSETLTQLLQHVEIHMTGFNHHRYHFRGDMHDMRLHCKTCRRKFGVEGNILVVLGGARAAILHHYGLEPIMSPKIPDDGIKGLVVLPEVKQAYVESPPIFSGISDFCQSYFPSGNEDLHDNASEAQGPCRDRVDTCGHVYQFESATKADAFHSFNEKAMSSQDEVSSYFLKYLFRCPWSSAINYFDMPPDTDSSIEIDDEMMPQVNFGSTEVSAHEDDPAPDASNTIRNSLKVAREWCHFVDDFATVIYFELTKGFPGIEQEKEKVWNNHDGEPFDYSEVGEQLRKYIITNEKEREAVLNKISNRATSIKCASKTVAISNLESHARPLQWLLEKMPSSSPDLGPGWTDVAIAKFFQKGERGLRKKAIKPRHMSVSESREANVIYRSLNRIKHIVGKDIPANTYIMECDLSDVTKMDPNLPRKFAHLFKMPRFTCSNELLTTLPHTFVTGLNDNTWKNLPAPYKKQMKSCVINAEKTVIRKVMILTTAAKTNESLRYTPGFVYRAFVITPTCKNGAWKAIKDDGFFADLKSEPWLFSHLTTLASIGYYRTVVLGDGFKKKYSKGSNDDGDLESDDTPCSPPDSFPVPIEGFLPPEVTLENVWHDSDNTMKFCTEGAITNMIFHAGAEADALLFKEVSTMEKLAIRTAMGVERIPKKVLNSRREMKPMEKCLWILREKFHWTITPPLNLHFFCSSSAAMYNVGWLPFPVVLSIEGTHAHNNHVVVVWQSHIIDFEEKNTYPLTAANLDYACGFGSSFLRVRFGCGLIPPKATKKICKRVKPTDWGHDDLKLGGKLYNMFKH